MPNFGDKLIQSMKEAVAYSKGEINPNNFRVHTVSVDVKQIRKRLKMTQKEFAADFGFAVDTVRHWEQKRRTPEGPAKAYLLVIAQKPEAVREALRDAMRPQVKERKQAVQV